MQRGATGPGLAVPFLSTTLLGGVATPIGVLGIVPMLPLQPTAVPHPNGTGALQFTLPMTPTLIGATVHAQALLLSATGGVHLTNVTSNVILR